MNRITIALNIYLKVEKFYCVQTSNMQHKPKSQTTGTLHYSLDHCLQKYAVCPEPMCLLSGIASPLSGHLCSLSSYPPTLQCSWNDKAERSLFSVSHMYKGNFLLGEMMFKV